MLFTFMGFTSSDRQHYRYNTIHSWVTSTLDLFSTTQSTHLHLSPNLPYIVSLLSLHVPKRIILLMFHLLTIKKLFLNGAWKDKFQIHLSSYVIPEYYE